MKKNRKVNIENRCEPLWKAAPCLTRAERSVEDCFAFEGRRNIRTIDWIELWEAFSTNRYSRLKPRIYTTGALINKSTPWVLFDSVLNGMLNPIRWSQLPIYGHLYMILEKKSLKHCATFFTAICKRESDSVDKFLYTEREPSAVTQIHGFVQISAGVLFFHLLSNSPICL